MPKQKLTDAMLNAMIASFDGDQTELVQVNPALYAIEYKQGLGGRAFIAYRQPQI
jgi:hypothetical protein